MTKNSNLILILALIIFAVSTLASGLLNYSAKQKELKSEQTKLET
jgi:hypothetical protein